MSAGGADQRGARTLAVAARAASSAALVVRRLGLRPYDEVWRAMREFSRERGPDTADEIWLLEHPSIYTLGVRGRMEDVLDRGAIPVVRTDRGGQVTYHGPGQLVAYCLLDLRRSSLGARSLVATLEAAVIEVLAELGVEGYRREGAPGVYVGGAKLASVGLRVTRGCCYHGLSLNVSMDLSPFRRIHPCGTPNLEVAQLADFSAEIDAKAAASRFERALIGRLTPLYPRPANATIPGSSP